jgi:hypothetical protein
MYMAARMKYMHAALYNVSEDKNTREMEKHDGVAANAGHGLLSAMIICSPRASPPQG